MGVKPDYVLKRVTVYVGGACVLDCTPEQIAMVNAMMGTDRETIEFPGAGVTVEFRTGPAPAPLTWGRRLAMVLRRG